MADELKGKRVAFRFTEGAEQIEVTAPLEAVRKAGADTEIISLEKGEVEMWKHFDKGDTITAEKAVADADPSDYDGLVLPGGVANPDQLRADKDAVQFVRTIHRAGQSRSAVICCGPWMLVETRRRQGPHAHLLAEPADRPAQRRRRVGRRGGRRRPGPGHEPQARRPAGVLRKGRTRIAERNQKQQTAA